MSLNERLNRHINNQIDREEFEKLLEDLKKSRPEEYEEVLLEEWNKNDKLRLLSSSKDRILDKIVEQRKDLKRKKMGWGIAAIAVTISLLVATTFIFFPLSNSTTNYGEHVYNTAFGEIQNVTLPDGTSVTLNGNSSLHFDEWNEEHPREVWLKGEAFFEVEKTPERKNPKFVVHAESIDVKVLGTKFNVNNRRGKTSVVLNSGKVSLSDNQNRVIEMIPGDRAIYENDSKKYSVESVNPNHYNSWIDNKLVFDNMSLLSIANILHDNYNINISFEESEVAAYMFTGEANIDQLEKFYKVLELAFEVSVDSSNKNNITIKR